MTSAKNIAAVLLLLASVGPPDVAEAIDVTRGPYLQLLTGDSVTIVWRTDASTDCSVAIRPLGGSARVVSGETTDECVVVVEDLDPGTLYGYEVRADGEAIDAEAVFRTDHPDLPFVFIVFGDSGDASSAQYRVRDRMLDYPADMMLHTGDVVYDDGKASEYDAKYFEPYAPLLRNLVLWPSLGNHDVRTLNGRAWLDNFFTPANNAKQTERYYSFDYGNAHFVALDTNTSTEPGSAQHTFLADDLAASDARWKFVFFHHSIYSAGDHGSATRLRADVAPLFDAYDVDMVFMGHEHSYERTFPMRNDDVVGPGEGTVYVTTGGGGRAPRPVGAKRFTAYAEAALHFTRIRVADNVLALDMIRDDGEIRDSATLVKVTDDPPRCGDDIVNRGGEQCDGVSDRACPGVCRTDCTCPPLCGDGVINQAHEECDGRFADAACPALCGDFCRCMSPPPALDLTPIADTYIDVEGEADWEHGGAQYVHIDGTPSAIGYLKFDLRAAVFPVGAATLTLSCVNGSDHGGTIYRVQDSDWIEGSGNGSSEASADGPGLKWIDVDTTGDGTVDDADESSYVPALDVPIVSMGPVQNGQIVTVDVTAALQGGPGIYTLAIVGESLDGVEYSTREHFDYTRHPVLHVDLDMRCHADAECDDGVFCNGIEVCLAGECRMSTNQPTGTPCADANVCNGVETCRDGACRPGVPLDCDDGDACTTDDCDTADGCEHVPLVDGSGCGDVTVCNGAETCQAGVCTTGTVLDCDDGNACTSDTCDPGLGCLAVPLIDGSGCTDDTVCNGTELCQAGVCTAGTPLECDDDNPCSADSCEAATGCRNVLLSGRCGPIVHEPIADTYIESGAQSGWDHGAADHLDVDEKPRNIAYLKFDLTDVAGTVEAATLTLRCLNPAAEGGTFYRVPDSTWVEGTETGADGPGLTWDAVDTSGDGIVDATDSSPFVPDFGRRLVALGSVAVGEAVSVDLTAAFQDGPGLYTIAIVGDMRDGSEFASREAGADARPRLTIELTDVQLCVVDADCDDGVVCNGEEICNGGGCEAGVPPVCDDGIGCTSDACDESIAGCVHTAIHGVCDDGIGCTDDICAPGAGGCVQTTGHARCDDGNRCTVDACDAVLGCQQGAVADGTGCTDDTVCNGVELCQAGVCVAGTALDCDDGDTCTEDRCDPLAGCRHVLVNGACGAVRRLPVADTYIEAGTQSSWDHGAADHLDVDKRPRDIAYLKFDLRDVSAPVEAATLRLRCVNPADEGGVLYAVDDSSWVEGTRDGASSASANGPGLTWDAVDTDGDGHVTAADSSPYVPDFTRPLKTLGAVADGELVSIDLTSLFQGGAGIYTIAIVGDVNDGAEFASREAAAADRPQLELQVLSYQPCGLDVDCDDGLACTGAERCIDGRCNGGMALDCDDGVSCTADACDEAAGGCVNVLIPAACDDNIACTDDACVPGAGGCVHTAVPARCNDGSRCTDDTCDPLVGCQYVPVANGTGCTDGTVCNGTELCQGGVCRPGTALDCDDGNVCTTDTCDPVLGCQHVPVANGTACADDDVCNGTETCQAGVCATGAAPDCDDGNPCTADSCAAAIGCQHAAVTDGTACLDGTVCNGAEACEAGVCTAGLALDCDDGNVCTTESCDAATGCQHAPVIDGTTCADGTVCNGNETCQAGVCTAGTVLDCDDGSVCTADGCDPAAGCQHVAVPNGTGCTDGTVCNGAELCQAGVCTAGTPLDCDDGNVCTTQWCDQIDGCRQLPVVNGTGCTDGTACNGIELCQAGVCTAGTPLDCDDDNACTVDGCDHAAGCEHVAVADGTACGDGSVCDGAATCQSGACMAGSALDCDDGSPCTIDGCDPVLGCVNTPLPDGTGCRDGTVCNGTELCQAGVCSAGTPLDCDDGSVCTDDTCDAASGCQHTPMADGTSCADGDVCNGEESCHGGVCTSGVALGCDDGDTCTADACDPTDGCQHELVCGEITLAPIADTYIEEGAEATWDHGDAMHVDSDTRPHGIIYLKFDLGSVTLPIESAALTLYSTNASDDGGTIYPVLDSSWVEGGGNGIDSSSAGGAGLKWIDVDTNDDREIDTADASPYVPDFTQPAAALGSVSKSQYVSADVASALQSGPGVYTLAIQSDSSDGVTYATRQHTDPARHPQLTLTLGQP